MRTIASTFLLALFSSAVWSQPNLLLEFKDLSNGKIFLRNSQKETIDTIAIEQGVAVYTTSLQKPVLYDFTVDGFNNRRPVKLVLSDQTTHIKFIKYKTIVETNGIDKAYPNQPKFIADPNKNQVFYDFLSNWKKFYNRIEELSADDSPEQFQKRKNTYEAFLSENRQLIRDNRDQYVSATVIDFLLRGNLLQMETLQEYYDLLNDSVKESYMGIKVGEKAGKGGRLQPGQPSPIFELTDQKGNIYNLKTLSGKNILLHFWSSSCAPCIKEAPDLLKLSKKFVDDLVIINISLDGDKVQWEKGIVKAKIGEMINVCDLQGLNSKVAKSFDITFIPAYYLIDTTGKISLKGTLTQVIGKLKNGMP